MYDALKTFSFPFTLLEMACSLFWMPCKLIASDTNRKVFRHGAEVSLQSTVWTRIPLTLRECKQTLKAKHMLKCILPSGKFPEPKPSHTLCYLGFFSVFEHVARAGPSVFPQLNTTSEKPMELNSVC